jgi:ABC-type Fe2+-enterobactin transport system substrate-binding protein
MSELNKTNRYDNVPLSDKTKKGMVLTIDDLAAIGRLLTLQDDYYDEQFQRIYDRLGAIMAKLEDHEKRIKRLERKLCEHLKEHKAA